MFNTEKMTGSTGTNFKLEVVLDNARIGTRNLENGHTRVRVEPATETSFDFPAAWSTPNWKDSRLRRYSVVVRTELKDAAVLDAVRIVKGVSVAKVTTVPEGTQFGTAVAIPDYTEKKAF